MEGAPTLDVASVRELRVVDLPEEGLPTRPINGSRGMLDDIWIVVAKSNAVGLYL